MSDDFDVIILGAGTAGLTALQAVRKQTGSVLMVNAGPYGTTCARVGCMPSKVLIEAANAFHRRHTFAAFGIRGADALRADIPAVLRRVRALRDYFVDSTLGATDALGARSIAGHARLRGPEHVEVDGTTYRARKIIVATGSRPVVPEAWRAFGARILTTDTLFEQTDLPQRIAVVGMGAVGIEMAQALSRLGRDVVGFDSGTTLAGLSDPTVAAALEAQLRTEFPIHLGAAAELVSTAGGIGARNGTIRVEVDAVLAAIGRRPNIDDIGLETLGVALGAKGMPEVDPCSMQIAGLPVYLVGDANGLRPILHESADEGYIAGVNAGASSPQGFARRTALGIVFSDPNVALIGQRYADRDPHGSLVGCADFDDQGRARAAQHNYGRLCIYADKQTGKLLGAELCAPAGEHLAHTLALALTQEMTVHALLAAPFYHPVLEEAIRTALRALADQLPAGRAPELSVCNAVAVEPGD